MTVAEDIWNACRDKRNALDSRRQQVAAITREFACEFGAKPRPDPGKWQLECPHCHRKIIFSEDKGEVLTEGPLYESCPAATLIIGRLRQRLVNEGLRKAF
jgi:hypothetical protein